MHWAKVNPRTGAQLMQTRDCQHCKNQGWYMLRDASVFLLWIRSA